MCRPSSERRGGFTLLEMSVGLVLLVLVIGNVYSILGQTSDAIDTRTLNAEADTQARRALERIAMAIVGAYKGRLVETAGAPAFVAAVNYEEYLGLEDEDGDGSPEAVLSDPMRIAQDGETGAEVTWYQNPGLPEEKHVVWLKDVPEFAIGETPNGLDDNDNGLIDESGLALVMEGPSVRILLSLRRPDHAGGFVERTVETLVTCRN